MIRSIWLTRARSGAEAPPVTSASVVRSPARKRCRSRAVGFKQALGAFANGPPGIVRSVLRGVLHFPQAHPHATTWRDVRAQARRRRALTESGLAAGRHAGYGASDTHAQPSALSHRGTEAVVRGS